MKKLIFALIALSGYMACLAQNDTTAKDNTDTIKVGGMIIIKKHGQNDEDKNDKKIIISNRHKKPVNISTNWFIFDLGFANINDQSNYGAAQTQGFVGTGIGKDQFNLKTGKSVNVNIWFFMQRLNIISHVVNLKYGLGFEMNNYRFEETRVRFSKNPTMIRFDSTLINIKKNKLAADYITIPLLLNFNLTPGRKSGFGFSAGISAGYLYSARQKIKETDGNKTKLHGNFDLRKWKLSYIGELNLGPVRLYGSYALKSMWAKALDQTPYTVGIRFSHL